MTRLHSDLNSVILMTASEGNPVEVSCEITCQGQSAKCQQLSPILRLTTVSPENGEFSFTDLELYNGRKQQNSIMTSNSKYYANFSIYPMNFSRPRALAMCGVRFHERHSSSFQFCFESSFVLISTHYNHVHSCSNNHELLMISIATGIFGFILIVSLLAVVGFLSLKLRRVAASTKVNPLLYVKKEVDDLEEKKDTLEREVANLSNDSPSSQHVGIIDHKLPDTIKSRENGTHSMPY